MSITIKSTRKNLERYAAEVIESCIKKLLKKQRKVVCAIPGGSSISGIFEKLKEAAIPWESVHLFMLDERIVPLNDESSNFKVAKESFIEPLIKKNALPKKNIHPFIMDASKGDLGLSHYEQLFIQCGGKLDVALLSAGEDGHIASLFPNHHSIKNEARFFLRVHNSPKPPKKRITMSKSLILSAQYGIILFFGKEKRTAYNLFIDDEVEIVSCPAKLALAIKDSFVFTDID